MFFKLLLVYGYPFKIYMDFIEVTILRKIFFFLKKVITHKIFVIPLFDEVFPWMKKKLCNE